MQTDIETLGDPRIADGGSASEPTMSKDNMTALNVCSAPVMTFSSL